MLQLLISAFGTERDYSQQVDWTSIKISESINIPATCSFKVVFSTSAFPVPPVRAYVKIYSTTFDRTLFTGFVSSPPVNRFLGRAGPTTVPTQALGQQLEYTFTCTSDEHLLNIKAVPFIPAFVNRTQGEILSAIAEILCPGFFDTSQVLDGDLVPRFEYTPTQSWCEIAKLFGDGSRYRYKAKDKRLYYVPYGDQPLGISYDETLGLGTFDAQALDTTVLAVPTVNDITIIGDAEAGNNREDYFIGDGFTGNFPLRHKVFRGATSVLLQETWQNASLNTQQWFLQDTFDNFDFTAGALNVLTGATGHPLGSSYIQYRNGIELAGGIDIQNGEFTFNDYCQGIAGGVYTDDLFTQSSFLGGFVLSSPSGIITSASGAAGIFMQPTWAGVNIGPAVVSKVNHTYVLQMIITAPRYSRFDRVYRTIDGEEFGGVNKDVTGSVQFFIQDFDITAATGFFYTPTITTATVNDVVMPAFVTFALLNNQRLNLTLGNTTLATMPLGGLKCDCGPSGLFQPTGAILPLLPESGMGGQYPGAVLPWPNPISGNYVLAPPGTRQGWQPQVLGSGLELEAAQISPGNDADTLGFYAQSIPIAGTPVRLQTWEQQAAVSRLQASGSIAEEAALVGDDGIRSAIVSDLNPLPRTSEDCDNAALAFLIDRGQTQYNGTYACTSYFFKGLSADLQFYPTCGRFLHVNSPARQIPAEKFLVTKLDISVLEAVTEVVGYQIQWGVDLYLEKVLKHFVDIKPIDVLQPEDKAQPPNPRFTQNVDNSFLPDINDMAPAMISDTNCTIFLLNSQQYPIEVRTVDTNWGRATVDLIGVFNGPQFTLPRINFDQTWFMRYVQNGVISRRSKVVRVRYPQRPSPPTFISSAPTQGPGPGGTTVPSFQVQLDYNGDIRSIYGIELRAADNKTILYQHPATSYANLLIDLVNMTPMAFLNPPLNTEFSLFAYFFNHQWSYSVPLIIDAQLLAGTRLPYIWSPGYTGIKVGEACTKRGSFGMQPFYTTDASGVGVAYAKVKGDPPVVLSSQIVGEPVLSAVASSPGSLPSGTYLVGASARDNTSASGFGVSPIDIVTVQVAASGSINFSVLTNVFGIDMYVATPNTDNGWFYNQTLAPGVLSGTITGPLFFKSYGAPDPLCNNLFWDIRRIWHGGIVGVQIAASGVTASTLTLAGFDFTNVYGLTPSGLVGRYFSELAHDNATSDVDYANFIIASAVASGTNTIITVGPGLDGQTPDLRNTFLPLDVITIRIQPQLITSTNISESGFLNNLNLGPKQSPTSITSSGTTATVTLPNHGFLTNQMVVVAGAAQANYNGMFIATVVDANTFTYVMLGSATSPATGTLSVQTIGGIVNQEVGRLLWIIYGTGSTQAKPYRTIVANDSFNFQLDSAWDVVPDSTSVMIFVNANSEPVVPTQALHTKNQFAFSGQVGLLNVENLANVAWFIRAFMQDSNGNQLVNDFNPFREIWIFGQAGLPVAFSATAVFSTLVPPVTGSNILLGTNAVKNQTQNDAFPVELDISAITPSTTGATTFQVETSPDLQTWKSLLAADASLPINTFILSPPISTFAPGAIWPQGYWLRARTTTGSALDALSVTVQTKFGVE